MDKNTADWILVPHEIIRIHFYKSISGKAV